MSAHPPPPPATAAPLARVVRPRWVAIVGMCSILFALLGGAFALFVAVQAFGLAATSGASPAGMVTLAPVRPATATTARGPRGIPAAERKAVVAALRSRRDLSPERVLQLDTLLATAGRDMAVDAVRESGATPALRPGDTACDYFVTAAGRLEVHDDRAVFFPTDGSPTVRVSADEATGADASGGSATNGSTSTALTTPQIASVITQAQGATSGALGQAQVATLTSELGAADQQLVAPGTAATAFEFAAAQRGGTAVVRLNAGLIALDPSGKVLSQHALAAPGTGSTARSGSAKATLGFAVAAVSAALALFLLFTGIATLADSPAGRRLHLAYAALKLPLVVLAAWFIELSRSEIVASVDLLYPVDPFKVGLLALPGAVYPLALLAVMNLPSMKRYYARARRASAMTPGGRTAILVVALVIGTLSVPLFLFVGVGPALRFVFRIPPPTAKQQAAAQQQMYANSLASEHSAYVRLERSAGARGQHFYGTVFFLDMLGRGAMSEQDLVRWLGPPDGMNEAGADRFLYYYYDRSAPRDSVALAALHGNVLKNFGYTGPDQVPKDMLLPYAPPTTAPTTTAPTTAPHERGAP